MKVLWLASWYPDEYEPTNGDFVQRHAKAVSTLIPVDVIHVAQAGRKFNQLNKAVVNHDGNLNEAIHYFTYKRSNINWLDKILYNKAYWRYYRNVIEDHIHQKGKPDLIHVHVPIKAGIIAMAFSKKYNISFIVSEHSSLYLDEAIDNFYTRNFYFRFYTKEIFKKASLVTNVSSAVGEVLKEMFHLKEVRTIPNVVDTNYFYFKPKEKNKTFRWLHVSTMYPLKNVDKIIHTFSSIAKQRDDWELIIVGPINPKYEKQVNNFNLQSKIKFTGEISHEKVAHQMQQADAFILFSKHENFPCVVIEALCCGLPVVTSNVGGIAEAVNDTNGILVEANNTDQLQTAIISIMNNPAHFNPGKISTETSLKYNYTAIARQFSNIYEEVLNLKSSPLKRI